MARASERAGERAGGRGVGKNPQRPRLECRADNDALPVAVSSPSTAHTAPDLPARRRERTGSSSCCHVM
ncbi:hypothetical protein ACLOJK_033712 [Asimina triloba]